MENEDERILATLFKKHAELTAILKGYQKMKLAGKKFNLKDYYATKLQLKKIEEALQDDSEDEEEGEEDD